MTATIYTTFTLLLLLHVLVAVLWVGGGVTMGIAGLQALATHDPLAVASAARTSGRIGRTIFTPSSLVVGLSGVALVADLGLPWREGWIVFALAAWLGSFALGMAFFGPQGARVGRLAAERGPADPEVQRRIRRILAVSRAVGVLLLLVIVDMTVKPAGADLAWLLVVGIPLTVLAVAADRLLPRPVARPVAGASALE